MAAPSGSLAERSVEDVLAGRIRIRLAGETYVLPVLTVGQNADWLASLEAELHPLIEAEDDLDVVMGLMDTVNDRLLDFVYSYDLRGLLPKQSTIERDVYPYEVLRAVMEVRLAANPTLGFALASVLEDATKAAAKVNEAMAQMPSAPTSSRRRRTAGRSRTSGKS